MERYQLIVWLVPLFVSLGSLAIAGLAYRRANAAFEETKLCRVLPDISRQATAPDKASSLPILRNVGKGYAYSVEYHLWVEAGHGGRDYLVGDITALAPGETSPLKEEMTEGCRLIWGYVEWRDSESKQYWSHRSKPDIDGAQSITHGKGDIPLRLLR